MIGSSDYSRGRSARGSVLLWTTAAAVPGILCLVLFGLMAYKVHELSSLTTPADNQFATPILWRTICFAALSAAAQTTLGLLFALAVMWIARRPLQRFLLITLIFVPYAVPSALLGLAYRLALGPRGDIAGAISNTFGISPQFWLLNHPLATTTVAVTWEFAPFAFLISYFALRSIKPQTLVAARADGGRFLDTLLRIVLRPIWPIVATTFALRLIFMLGKFDTPYIFTKLISSTVHVASVEIYPAFQASSLRGVSLLAVGLFETSIAVCAIYLVARRYLRT